MRSTELLEMLCDEGDRVRRVERAAVVAWLREMAEEGGDPWMSYCADKIARGEHIVGEQPWDVREMK